MSILKGIGVISTGRQYKRAIRESPLRFVMKKIRKRLPHFVRNDENIMTVKL
jgi:hypothetical protein